MKYRIHLKLAQMLKINPKHVDNIAEKVFAKVKELSDAAGMDPNEVEVKRSGRVMDPEETKGRKFPGEPDLKNERTFAILATTPHMDRDREVVLSKGIDLSEWEKTGVILDSHNYNELPIGKAVWVGQTDRGIKMHIEAAPTPRGDEVIALAKFMPLTASIGFIPTQIIDKNSTEFPKEMGKLANKFDFLADKRDAVQRIISKSILLENSIVSVPANPNAIQDVLAKAQEAHSAGEITTECLELVTKSFGDSSHNGGEKKELNEAEWIMNGPETIIKGTSLASLLNELIGDEDRGAEVERVASAGGISASTMNGILAGTINCPPLQRLRGFARALSVPVSRLVNAAEKDGCEYSDESSDRGFCRVGQKCSVKFDPEVTKAKRTVKVLTQPRTVKVISTPEEQNKAIADGVRSELDLHKGGV